MLSTALSYQGMFPAEDIENTCDADMTVRPDPLGTDHFQNDVKKKYPWGKGSSEKHHWQRKNLGLSSAVLSNSG